MEHGAAGPRQTADHRRDIDPFLADFGMAGDHVEHAQSADNMADHPCMLHGGPGWAQPRLVIDRIDQPAHRLKEVIRPEIVEAGLTDGGVEDRLAVERAAHRKPLARPMAR